MSTPQSAAALFPAGAFRAIEMVAEDIPRLQRFFELNPGYFFAVTGLPPTATEAHDELRGTPPEGWPFTRTWVIGFVDETDSLAGMANVATDLLAPGVWHIGLFIVAARLHGSGAAQALYEHLERWARDSGAQWLRLGVVEGNTRAERFWARCGYVEVRKRGGVEMGKLVNTICVMAKPLAGRTIPEYLALVECDSPEPG